jgi:hypothetical protein
LDFEQGAVFSYHYDFGDGWRHTVTVEEFLSLATTPNTGAASPANVRDRRKMLAAFRNFVTKGAPARKN